jgi:hypothetical protein
MLAEKTHNAQKLLTLAEKNVIPQTQKLSYNASDLAQLSLVTIVFLKLRKCQINFFNLMH